MLCNVNASCARRVVAPPPAEDWDSGWGDDEDELAPAVAAKKPLLPSALRPTTTTIDRPVVHSVQEAASSPAARRARAAEPKGGDGSSGWDDKW